ncbi:unnamed protein product [Macrosiphum euphorbiae]|uniref:Uncharacterized protein n=1 Tax=Macrosiphum euphorbiae TaxID=13131 RepID=A0AAV0YBY4_9HEMI|nr:unnamed protein product [Macrosiphum euphorbiae]
MSAASTKSKESSPNLLHNLRSKSNQKPTNGTTDIMQSLQSLKSSIKSMNTKLEAIQTSVSEQKIEFIEIRKYFDEISGTVSTLKTNYDIMKTEVSNLRQQIDLLTNNNTALSFEAVHEAQVRLRKSRNVIIFNVPDNNESIDETNKSTSNIINYMVPNVPIIKTTRLGINRNKPRPILVELENNDAVLSILKAKSKLRQSDNWNRVWITTDLMMMQRNQLTQVKLQLRNKIDAGDLSWYIKFVHGNPILSQKNAQPAQA